MEELPAMLGYPSSLPRCHCTMGILFESRVCSIQPGEYGEKYCNSRTACSFLDSILQQYSLLARAGTFNFTPASSVEHSIFHY